LSDSFPIHIGLKQEGLTPMLFSFVLEDTIRKVQENQVEITLIWTHQLLVYAVDVNLLGGTIMKNTETFIDYNKGVGLVMNVGNTKYMLLSHHQKAGQIRYIKIASTSFENVAQCKCLLTTALNQSFIQDEILEGWNSGNAYYRSIQNLLFSRVVSKNVKMKIYTTLILSVVLYGCETWSPILREVHTDAI
jgi:hypothetical protein